MGIDVGEALGVVVGAKVGGREGAELGENVGPNVGSVEGLLVWVVTGGYVGLSCKVGRIVVGLGDGLLVVGFGVGGSDGGKVGKAEGADDGEGVDPSADE